MTKKDYELIAEVLANTETLSSIQRLALAGEMAGKLARDNPRFSAERFVAAVIAPKLRGGKEKTP